MNENMFSNSHKIGTTNKEVPTNFPLYIYR